MLARMGLLAAGRASRWPGRSGRPGRREARSESAAGTGDSSRPPRRRDRARRLEPDGPAIGGGPTPSGPIDRLGPGVRQAAQAGRLGRGAREPRTGSGGWSTPPSFDLDLGSTRPSPTPPPARGVERPPLGDWRGVPDPREGPATRARDVVVLSDGRRASAWRPGDLPAGGRCSATSAAGCRTRRGSGSPSFAQPRTAPKARPTARSARCRTVPSRAHAGAAGGRLGESSPTPGPGR